MRQTEDAMLQILYICPSDPGGDYMSIKEISTKPSRFRG